MVEPSAPDNFGEQQINDTKQATSTIKVQAPANDPAHNAHKIKSSVFDIDGIPTTIIAQPFADRFFIIVTQRNKIGTILSASVDVTLAGAQSFNVQVLMGKRDVPEMELCARSVMSIIKSAGNDKPLLLSLALQDHTLPTIHAIIDKIKSMAVC